MRRFLLCTFLLLLTLAVASVVDSSGDWLDSTDLHLGGTLEARLDAECSSGFFDHRYEPTARRDRSDERLGRRERHAPRRVPEGIRFRYRDRGYAEVLLQGSFADWEPEPMGLSADGEVWEITRPLPPGRHRYRFVVRYEDGRERRRVDPSHSRRVRDEERGWVSLLEVSADGEIQRGPSEVEGDEWDADDYDLELLADLELDYQRVDGWVLGARPGFRSHEPWSPALEARVAYGFKSDRWQTGLSLLQPLTPHGRLRLVLSGYDRTDFPERTGVGDVENLFSTLMFREDNRDYHRREGVSVGVEAEWAKRLLARLEYRSDEHSSLDRTIRAGWWGREDFLPNPDVDEGIMRSLYARLRVGDELHHLWVGWELSRPGMSSDFDFQQLMLRGRTRARLGRSQYLDFRAQWGGNLGGELPRQKRYVLGGIGTVRGYRYQSLLRGAEGDPTVFGGEQMVLATAEYVLGVQNDVMLAVFADTGMAYADRRADLDPDDWVSSAGLGVILGDDDGLRLDLIKPLDAGGDDLMLQARLERSF